MWNEQHGRIATQNEDFASMMEKMMMQITREREEMNVVKHAIERFVNTFEQFEDIKISKNLNEIFGKK